MSRFGTFFLSGAVMLDGLSMALRAPTVAEARGWRMPQSRYAPHQGEREVARRKRQTARGQIRFVKHGSAA